MDDKVRFVCVSVLVMSALSAGCYAGGIGAATGNSSGCHLSTDIVNCDSVCGVLGTGTLRKIILRGLRM